MKRDIKAIVDEATFEQKALILLAYELGLLHGEIAERRRAIDLGAFPQPVEAPKAEEPLTTEFKTVYGRKTAAPIDIAGVSHPPGTISASILFSRSPTDGEFASLLNFLRGWAPCDLIRR